MRFQADATSRAVARSAGYVAIGISLLVASTAPVLGLDERAEASASPARPMPAMGTAAPVPTMAPMTTMAPMATMSAGLLVHDAWTRESPMLALAAGAFMVIENTTTQPDALVGATSPAADLVELHQTARAADGTMAMTPVESIPVPAGGRAVLEPGGYHAMLIGLRAPLEAGTSIEITLRFEHASPRTVHALVQAMGPLAPDTGASPAPRDD
jgi:copper(I)-binding protein